MTDGRKLTDAELVAELRDKAAQEGSGSTRRLLELAARRIEGDDNDECGMILDRISTLVRCDEPITERNYKRLLKLVDELNGIIKEYGLSAHHTDYNAGPSPTCASCRWRDGSIDICANDFSDKSGCYVYKDETCGEWEPKEQ